MSAHHAIGHGAMSERVIELRLPSIRLFPGARYRCLKMRDDRRAWAERWQQVQDLQDDGWQVDAITVDWGNRSRPGTEAQRLDWYRSLMGDAPIREGGLDQVNGAVRVVMVKAMK